MEQMSNLHADASVTTEGAEAKAQALEEENRLLFDQLTVVQEELERLHYTGATRAAQASGRIEPQRVGDGFVELHAEYLRCQALLTTQQEVHRLEQQHSLVAKLGTILIQATTSPSAMLKVPVKLLNAWRENRQQTPPAALGGTAFGKVIAVYEDGGTEAVERLLDAANASFAIQADAWTAVARSTMPMDPSAAADAARRAYTIDPKGFRLKWLAFRLYEANELVEAEAMLSLLPPNIKLSQSEQQKSDNLKTEAIQHRLETAKQHPYQHASHELRL